MKIWCGTCKGIGYVDDLSYRTRIGVMKPCVVCEGNGYIEYDTTIEEFLLFHRMTQIVSIDELKNTLDVYNTLQYAFNSGYAVTDEYGLGYNLSNDKELLEWFNKIKTEEFK